LKAIQRRLDPVQARGRPGRRGRGAGALGVQRFGDALEAQPLDQHVDDPTDGRGLDGIDAALNVLALAAFADDRDVVVAEDRAAGDEALAGPAEERITGALPRLVALHLGRVGRHGEQELIGGGVEPEFAILEVVEHAHARDDDLLQEVGRLNLLATEAIDVAHDEDLEGRAGLEGGEEAHEAGPALELGAADPVIDVGVLAGEGPALPRGVRLRVLDLARDGLVLGAHIGLLGGLSGVDGGDHRSRPSLPEEFRVADAAGASKSSSGVAGAAGRVGTRVLGPGRRSPPFGAEHRFS